MPPQLHALAAGVMPVPTGSELSTASGRRLPRHTAADRSANKQFSQGLYQVAPVLLGAGWRSLPQSQTLPRPQGQTPEAASGLAGSRLSEEPLWNCSQMAASVCGLHGWLVHCLPSTGPNLM